ncbi:VRR-NUC domain-containing protein [Paenibacillus sp. BR2-3]|uniref:VRR-NUC domain-containing protein n=1 Tax=Paenibacillus sp. BR2-3 TaxID=3048494 RepID=UPI0039773FDB
MREREIEEYLRKQVKAVGGIAYKWTSPGNAGVPDRIVVLPGGHVYFTELKAPGGKPTPLQLLQHRKLSTLGCEVKVISSKEQVDAFIQGVQS